MAGWAAERAGLRGERAERKGWAERGEREHGWAQKGIGLLGLGLVLGFFFYFLFPISNTTQT